MKTRICITALMLSLCLCLTAWAFPVEKTEILFTQIAPRASLKILPGKKDFYELKLYNVKPTTTWFVQRPNRKAGAISTKTFVKSWNIGGHNSFNNDNPNASIVFSKKEEKEAFQTIDIFQLSHPKYDTKNHTLTYQAKNLGKNKIASMQIKNIALFIDSIKQWCFGPSICIPES